MNDVTTRLNIIKGKSDGVKELDKLNKELSDIRKSLTVVGKQSNSTFDAMSSGARDAKRDLDTANQSAEKLTQTYRDQREAVGDVSTALGSIASVGGALGGGAGSEALAFGGDIFGAIEYLPNLSDAVKTLGASASASTGIVGSLASVAIGLVPALGGVGAGLVAISAVALPFVAVGAGVVAVFALLNEQAERAKKATEFVIDATFAELDARAEVTQLIKDRDIPAIHELAEANNAEINTLTQKITALNEMEKVQGADVEQIKARRAELETDLTARFQSFAVYSEALNSEQVKSIETAQAIEKLTEQYTQQTAETDKLKASVEALNEQENALIDAQETRRAQQVEDLRLKAQENALLTASQTIYEARKTALDELFASEDAKAQQDEQNAGLAKRLADIQASASEKIGALQSDLVKRQTDASEQIADIQNKAQADSAKRLADFERKKRDIENKFQQARFDALLNNDVTALFQAQQERKSGKKDASAEFTQAEQEAKLANETRIMQIQSELAEFTVAQNEKIRVENEAIKKRQDAEIKAFNDNEKLEASADEKRRKRAEAYARLEEQLASQREAITTTFENRRNELTRQREDASLASQLQRIDVKRDAELLALDAVKLKADELAQAILEAKGGATVMNTGAVAPSSNGGLVPFANGGIVTRPTRALIGESGAEMVVPLTNRNGRSFGRSLTINASGMFSGANFGAVLSPSDLQAFQKEVEGAFNQFAHEFLSQTQ